MSGFRWNHWIRQLHRWVSVVFVAVVVVVTVLSSGGEEPAEWVYLTPLLPLALLALTGLYLFALPYLGKRGGGGPRVPAPGARDRPD